MTTVPRNVEITGPAGERYEEILTPEALGLLAALHGELADRRLEALAARRRRQAELSNGAMLDFLPQTAHIREDDSWRGAPPAPGLEDRRVEITAPADRKTTISALNSGASVWVADFEDTSTPRWENMIGGQLNLKDALEDDETLATIVVRPRGWHLEEKHILIDERRASASLTDFALYMAASARKQVDKGKGPYFCLPKLESHLEARLWNDAFVLAQESLGLPRGTIRATASIETIPAAFEMDEILHELREHSAGLNTDRWDYLSSIIRKFRTRGKEFILPERNAITMTAPMMRACTGLLVQTCRKRGAHATTAGAEQHPEAHVTARELLAVSETPGEITEAGLRDNISVGLQYLAAWLGGNGEVTICGLMADTATAEIARSQVWQWLHNHVRLEDGTAVTADLVEELIDEELLKIRALAGDDFDIALYGQAVALFSEVALADSFPEFLTVPAYERMP